MPTLTSIRKAAERAKREGEGKGNINSRYIQGLIVEDDLAVIDHILVNELKFINADGSVIVYEEPDS